MATDFGRVATLFGILNTTREYLPTYKMIHDAAQRELQKIEEDLRKEDEKRVNPPAALQGQPTTELYRSQVPPGQPVAPPPSGGQPRPYPPDQQPHPQDYRMSPEERAEQDRARATRESEFNRQGNRPPQNNQNQPDVERKI